PASAPDVERLRESSRLRRILETARLRAVAEPRDCADAQRRRVVGSGRLLRPRENLRVARAARYGEQKLPRHRPVESRRGGGEGRTETRAHKFSERDSRARPAGEYGARSVAPPEQERRA